MNYSVTIDCKINDWGNGKIWSAVDEITRNIHDNAGDEYGCYVKEVKIIAEGDKNEKGCEKNY